MEGTLFEWKVQCLNGRYSVQMEGTVFEWKVQCLNGRYSVLRSSDIDVLVLWKFCVMITVILWICMCVSDNFGFVHMCVHSNKASFCVSRI